ncbi:MAG: HEPN domain-containing protein [Anaerolineae bacterium]|nr:HEPN domain-containing protein [Anaerolineae bacterium]
MKTNLDLAHLLIRKAESDLAAVHRTITSEGPYDTGLFHCQQAVEKYLKALLAVHNINYPKIHDVTVLAELGEPFCPALSSLSFSLAEFNPFAVTIRYDDLDLNHEHSLPLLQEMLEKADQVRTIILNVLPEEIRPLTYK